MAITEKTKLTWDPDRLVYLTSRGYPVDPRDIRKWIDKMVTAAGDRLWKLGNDVREGKLTISRWQTLAAKEIKNVHTAAFTIAMGGKDHVGFTGIARLGDVMQFQFEHLRDFAKDIPRQVSDRDGRIPARIQSYATAAIGTYENGVLDRNIDFGLSIARRNTAHGVESCETCLEEEDAGWQDINTIRRIGDSPCGARCNCVIEYEKVTPGRATMSEVVVLIRRPLICPHCHHDTIEHRRAA